MTNVVSLQQVWIHTYQMYHLKQPVFRMIADEKIGDNLEKGDTINFRQLPDFYYDTLGTDGTYTAQGYTEVNETLTISYRRTVPIRLVDKDLEQQDTKMKLEYSQLAMNRLFIGIDADVLLATYQGAFYVIDANVLAGSAASTIGAAPITLNTPAQIPQLFATAQQTLQLANVVYDPNLSFSRDVKLKVPRGMCVAIVSPQVFAQLVIYLGGKTTVLGDKVSVSGHQGAFMGFNIYVSNNLPSSAYVTLAAATVSNNDTFTLNGLVFTFVSSIGSTAGNILIGANSTATIVNLAAGLAAPFTTTSTYVAQANTTANQLSLYGINVAIQTTATTAIIQQAGNLLQITAVTLTNASNSIAGVSSGVASNVIQHSIFGVSNSIAMCLQGKPRLTINPVSNATAKDYVTWCYFGLKVFKTQAKQLIDVQIQAALFTPALNTNY